MPDTIPDGEIARGSSTDGREQKMRTTNIADRVVVITGASSGIGESTAKHLARNGAKVVLGARRKDRIDAVVKEISVAGSKAIGFGVDVTKRAEVESLIKGADNFGRVDVMVNDAGIMRYPSHGTGFLA
jgi:NADP-dependent 3-hydroxy acid dehydrogenase YdfG